MGLMTAGLSVYQTAVLRAEMKARSLAGRSERCWAERMDSQKAAKLVDDSAALMADRRAVWRAGQ